MSSYDALAASYDALTVDVEYRRRADYLTCWRSGDTG